MATVDPRAVAALRRLTDQPVSACRQALVEAGGDLAAVVRRLQRSPCCGLRASDAEVDAVLRSLGLPDLPPEPPRVPRPVADEEVVAGLTAGGRAVADFFLVAGLVCSLDSRGGLMGCVIEDDDVAAATKAYLRRIGVREYASLAAYREARPG